MIEELYQGDEDEGELNDVSVGHRVEAAQQGVDDGHASRDPDARSVGQVQDHAHGYALKTYTCQSLWCCSFGFPGRTLLNSRV